MNRRAEILIVDDSSGLRTAVRGILTERGHSVSEAASGSEALDLLEGQPYDLTLLDLRMPGMDGIELMHRIREERPELPIIILTGAPSLESAIAAVREGALDYLLKPFSDEGLVATVDRALQVRVKQQQRQQLLSTIGETVALLQNSELNGDLTAEEVPSPLPSEATERAPSSDIALHAGSLVLNREKLQVSLEDGRGRVEDLT